MKIDENKSRFQWSMPEGHVTILRQEERHSTSYFPGWTGEVLFPTDRMNPVRSLAHLLTGQDPQSTYFILWTDPEDEVKYTVIPVGEATFGFIAEGTKTMRVLYLSRYGRTNGVTWTQEAIGTLELW